MPYWVVGGEYQSTRFQHIVEGKEEERHGPFATADKAREKWAALAMATVDNAHVRYRIEKEDAAQEYWVVGGRYTGTDFKDIRDGHEKERYGPFKTEEAAVKKWREKAWETVDDAFAAYRVERVNPV
jgi:hypothetical protein